MNSFSRNTKVRRRVGSEDGTKPLQDYVGRLLEYYMRRTRVGQVRVFFRNIRFFNHPSSPVTPSQLCRRLNRR